MTKLRGAIVGCGYFSQFHLDAWRRLPEVEIVAACDRDIDRARSAAPRAYSDVEQMLESEVLDFVDLATPPESHLDLLRAVTRNQIPAIIQKPLAPSWSDALEASRIAQEAKARVMVHENWRWQPWYREIKQLLSAGVVGAPICYCFRTRQADGKGPAPYRSQPYFVRMPRFLVHEVLVHHIDTASFLFGDIERVYATLRRLNPVIAGEDRALLVLRHKGGVDGAIDAHRYLGARDLPVMGDAWFEGEEGRLTVDDKGNVWAGTELAWANDRQGYRGDSVYATIRHFVDCLITGQPFETELVSYIRAVAVVECAYKSAAEARAVNVDELLWASGAPAA